MSALFGFLLGDWKRIVGFILVIGLVSVLARFQWLEAQHRSDQAALTRANELRIAAQARADIATAALAASRRLHEVENTLNVALNQGHNEIHEAVNAEETRALFLAWAASDRRLCDATSAGCGALRA